MRLTCERDDGLVADAALLTGVTEPNALIREALRALVQRESARRIAALGATEPTLRVARRRRSRPPKSK